MTLHDIEAFIAAAEAGSINRAALRLNLTQPATTRRIQNFEAAFGGAPLFDRAVKPASLTAFGARVLEECRAVMAAVARLETLRAGHDNPDGIMKIGVAHGLGEIVLTAPLDGTRQRFPNLRLHVSSDWTTALIEQVRGGALDCAVGLLTDAHARPPSLTHVGLGAETIVVVAPKTFEGRTSCCLADLSPHGWVLNPPGCGCRNALVRAFDRGQHAMHVTAEVFGEALQLALLARSGGLGLVPRRELDHSPHRHELRILDVRDFRLEATVTMVRPALAGRLAPAIEMLISELRKKLGDQ